MSVPIYDDGTVTRLLEAEKYVRASAFVERFSGIATDRIETKRISLDTSRASFTCRAEIECKFDPWVDSLSIALRAGMGPKQPMEWILRCDIHDAPHLNVPPCPNHAIDSREPHVHEYSHAAHLEHGSWCKCARSLRPVKKSVTGPGPSVSQEELHLVELFLECTGIIPEEDDGDNLLFPRS